MKLVMLPVLVALLAQFGTLPLLIGARTPGEMIGWPMIMAIFFGIPSILLYFIMFGAFGATSPSPALAVILGMSSPAALVIGNSMARGRPIDLGRKNYVLWMGMIGGLAGTITHLHLRSNLAPA